MKKRLLGEKTGLKIELNRINFFLLFFFLSSEILPQIPINGFCKLNDFQFSPGYSKIFSFNYNNDSYSDLLFYNSSSKKISVVAGEKNGTFRKEIIYDFPFFLSSLAPMRERNNQIKNYAFTSRKNLSAGICEFKANGKPHVTHQMVFQFYPEKLSIADIDGDYHPEVLLSGAAFDGMCILSVEGKSLRKNTIVSNASYSDAVFIDLSGDHFPDIAAINLLNSTLEFFYNDGRGKFKLVRSISLNAKASHLHAFDMNLDSYQDLVFLEEDKIKIMYGDFSSSYAKQIEIRTNFSPNDFTIGDFNKDGMIDLAYLNTDISIVSAIFAKDDFNFFSEVPIIHKEGMHSIIPFYSKFIDGLAVICEDGTLLTNTRLSSFSSDLDLSLSLNPEYIFHFDAYNNSINDLCFIDNFDNSLKMIIRNIDGIPADYFSVPLRGNHNKIEVGSFSKQATTFFCYSTGKRLIEVVEVNLETWKIVRSEFYSARDVTELKIFPGSQGKLFVTSLSNNRLTLEIFEKENGWKLFTDYNISEKVISVAVSSTKGFHVFFWNQEGDSIKLFKKTFFPEEAKAELISKLEMNKITDFLTIADDFLDLTVSTINFVESDKKRYILITNDRFIYSFDAGEIKKNLQIKGSEQVFSSEVKTNGMNKLIINDPQNQSIYKLNILGKGEKINISRLRDKINATKFFVKNMTMNNFHIVYLDLEKGCISIRQI